MTILVNLEVLTNPSFRDFILYGITLENSLMFAAIASRFKGLEKQREHSMAQLKKVCFPHQLKQIRAGKSLEETMPVGEREACIIAFDVIQSSRFEPRKFAIVMEDFMQSCRNLLMFEYNPNTLQSTGYMVKEMGDGFLCSIGFPFYSVDKNLADASIILSLQIIELFDHHMTNLDSDLKPTCSIGISRGSVQGYFSQSGAIRHDLWGHAITQATRYESARKSVLSFLPFQDHHIITIQEKIFHQLSDSFRQDFEVFDLSANKLRIRDDADAKKLAYYCRSHSKSGMDQVS